jgi:predicted DNA-binding protein
MERLTVDMPDEMHQKLKDLGHMSGRPMSEFVRRGIVLAIREQERKDNAKQGGGK